MAGASLYVPDTWQAPLTPPLLECPKSDESAQIKIFRRVRLVSDSVGHRCKLEDRWLSKKITVGVGNIRIKNVEVRTSASLELTKCLSYAA